MRKVQLGSGKKIIEKAMQRKGKMIDLKETRRNMAMIQKDR